MSRSLMVLTVFLLLLATCFTVAWFVPDGAAWLAAIFFGLLIYEKLDKMALWIVNKIKRD